MMKNLQNGEVRMGENEKFSIRVQSDLSSRIAENTNCVRLISIPSM